MLKNIFCLNNLNVFLCPSLRNSFEDGRESKNELKKDAKGGWLVKDDIRQ